MAPCHERIDSLAEKTLRAARLRQKRNHDKNVAIVLFGFPPNAGATGTAAYLDVFESLQNTLMQMKADGYDVALPETVAHLRPAARAPVCKDRRRNAPGNSLAFAVVVGGVDQGREVRCWLFNSRAGRGRSRPPGTGPPRRVVYAGSE